MGPTPPIDELRAAYRESLRLDADGAATLAREVAADPESLMNRARLLGALTGARSSFGTEDLVLQFLWWIDRHPDKLGHVSGVSALNVGREHPGYERMRDAWTRQITAHPNDIEVQIAAAQWFAEHEADRALPILERVHAMTTHDPRPAWVIAHLWGRLAVPTSRDHASPHELLAANKALSWFEKALDRESDPTMRGETMRRTCGAALRAQSFSRAKELADELMRLTGGAPSNPEDFRSTWIAHLAYGRIAMRDKDVDAARRHLVSATEAMRASKSRIWRSPDLELADELLQLGERDVVLDFLRSVRTVFKDGAACARIDLWSLDIENGERPRLSTCD
jgi:hypothetical protein